MVISQQRFPWDPTWNYQQSEYGDYQIVMMDVQSIPVTSKSKHFLRSGELLRKTLQIQHQSLGSCFQHCSQFLVLMYAYADKCNLLGSLSSWFTASLCVGVGWLQSQISLEGFCSSSNSQHSSWCCGRVSPLHWQNNPPPLWKLCCPFTFLTCKSAAWPMHWL